MTKSGRGAPRAPVLGDSHPAGGCRPGLPLDSRPNPGLHWPPGRIGAPWGATPGRGASAQPARCSRRNLGFRYPLGRVWEMGPKRQPGTVHETSGGPGCRAPQDAFRFAELPTALPGGERRLGTGHETNGGPSRSPPALPFASEGARGPPRSIFGHFLLIKKVATRGLGFCLTNSQTETLLMAQGKTSPDFRSDRSKLFKRKAGETKIAF